MATDTETQTVIATFLDETREAFQEIEPTLVELEMQIGTEEEQPLINSIFGLYHSVKGGAGLLEFGEIERVTHAAESVLQKVRDGELPLDELLVDLLCRGLDFVSERLDTIEATMSDRGDEARADELVARFAIFAPELSEDREDPAILLFIDDDIVMVEDDGTGEVIDDPPELRATPLEPRLELSGPANPERVASLMEFVGPAVGQLDSAYGALERVMLGEVDVAIIDDAWTAVHQVHIRCGELELHDLQLAAQTAGSVIDRLLHQVRHDAEHTELIKTCERIRAGIEAIRDVVVGVQDGGDGRMPHLDTVAATILGTQQRVDTTRLGDILLKAAYVTPEVLEEAIARQNQRPRLGEVLVEMEVLAEEELDKALDVQEQTRDGRKPPPVLPPRTKKHETLRVDVEKVDRLMDLVGELIIGVTSVVHHPSVEGLVSDHFEKSAAQLTRVTRDMQDVAMSLRMVPVRNSFRKMKRLVRDLAKKLGKQIRLDITGEETEVDKSVAEVIADPLVHLVRNAIDHGLETPAERTAAGKAPEGTVHLTARHQGGEVWIEIIDDGRGIDRQTVYARARSRGLTDVPFEELSEREIDHFIFQPGFSTAVQVSELSGRGMGMDVVKRNVESVNGRIEIQSQPGRGSRISLRIPLTLAIIEGMLVRVGESCFTIPLLQIRESMVVTRDDITVLSNGQEIVKIREQLLPLVRMHQFYDIPNDATDVSQGIVMVVEDAGVPLCLFVDELIGQRQTVIKGLSGYLRAIRGLSGCTVLGDGRISFILDVASLRSHAVAQGVA